MYHFMVTLTLALTSNLVKIQLFLNMVMLHIKLKGMKYTTTCKFFLPLRAFLTSECGQKVKTCFFLKMVMLHIKLKRMTHTTTCKQLVCPYRHPRPVGSHQKVKTVFSESSHVGYKMKENEIEIFCSYTHSRPLGRV